MEKKIISDCENKLESLQFILRVLGGKWKIPILSKLYYGRFKELEREVTGISPKMLIKELKDLEIIGIIDRKAFNTVPITVEYNMTQEGLTLKPILDHIMQWSSDFKKQTARDETNSNALLH